MALQANVADAGLSDTENNFIRDVRLAWLEAEHALLRQGLTASLLANANATLELAQVRFAHGLSSIVELNQAELSQVTAELANTSAKYDYRVRREILDFQTGSLH